MSYLNRRCDNVVARLLNFELSGRNPKLFNLQVPVQITEGRSIPTMAGERSAAIAQLPTLLRLNLVVMLGVDGEHRLEQEVLHALARGGVKRGEEIDGEALIERAQELVETSVGDTVGDGTNE